MGKRKLLNIRLITSLMVATLCVNANANVPYINDVQYTSIINNLNHDVSVSKFTVGGDWVYFSSGSNELKSGSVISIPAGTTLKLTFTGPLGDTDRYGTMVLNPSSDGGGFSSVYYGYAGHVAVPGLNYRFFLSNIYNLNPNEGTIGDEMSSGYVANRQNYDPNILYHADAYGSNELLLTENVCANQPTIGRYLNCLKD